MPALLFHPVDPVKVFVALGEVDDPLDQADDPHDNAVDSASQERHQQQAAESSDRAVSHREGRARPQRVEERRQHNIRPEFPRPSSRIPAGRRLPRGGRLRGALRTPPGARPPRFNHFGKVRSPPPHKTPPVAASSPARGPFPRLLDQQASTRPACRYDPRTSQTARRAT
jgi:hypothetical protein